MRVFLAVSRAESLTGAAPILKMDPATLSRRIARLERRLGSALFVKSPQGYALTDLGERIRDRAADAEAHLTRAFDVGQGTQATLTGQVRIGAPDGVSNYLLPQVCASIQEDNPDLDIQILALPRAVNLSRREADMAITVSPPNGGRLSSRKVVDYHLHLAARRDGPKINTLSDLKGLPVVGYIPDMIFDKELDYLGGLGLQRVQLASNSVAVQLQMIRQTGLGVVHDFAMPFAPELQQVLPEEVCLRRSLYLVRHLSDRLSDRLSRFAEALSVGLQSEVERLEGGARLTRSTMI